jgi:hypothetical protein
MSRAIAFLFQNYVISEGDNIKLLEKSRTEQASQLMGILHRSKNRYAFVELIGALREEKDQEWIVMEIMEKYNSLIAQESTLMASLSLKTQKR